MEERAFAKLNLALHVRAREPDGYHRIETIFAFADDGDRLSVAPADSISLRLEGQFAAALAGEEDNLVLGAAERLRRRFGVHQGAALLLDKRLPVASGIGGGSADAAAALRLLDRFWGLDAGEPVLRALAAGLGADVPACVASVTVRGEGRGDRLLAADGAATAGLPLLLVNPGVPLSTASVFRAWDGVDRGPLATGALAAAADGRNDLEPAASAIAPEIAAVLERLRKQPGVRLARMSGSGATCFALFDSEAERDAAEASLGEDEPSWWCFAARLR